ncbi:hypothetical protein ACET3Z_011140 [Daucus carota]
MISMSMLSKLPTNLPPHLSLKFIKIYLNSGDLLRARQLFDKILQPDIHSCTVLINAYTKQGHAKEALNLYSELRARDIQPDKLALLSVAKACASLSEVTKAKEIGNDVKRFGFCGDLFLGNALIDMYGKCRYIDGAKDVFSSLQVRDVISWTSLCSCYFNCGMLREGFRVFREMGLDGVRANSVSVSSVLPVCSKLKDLNAGREVHGYVIKNGMEENVFVSSALVDMYASCLCIDKAQLVFENMSWRDIVSWNVILTAYFGNGEFDKAFTMFNRMRNEGIRLNYASWNAIIGGCVQNGRTEQALEIAIQMQKSGLKPNHITITSVLPACTHLESLRGGKEIHGFMFRHWFLDDITATTALVYMI